MFFPYVVQTFIHHPKLASFHVFSALSPNGNLKKTQHEPLVIFQFSVLERLVEDEGFLKWSEEIKMNDSTMNEG